MKKQTGSGHVIIIAAVAVALIGALGFVFWQNYMKVNDSTDQSTVSRSESTEEDAIELAEDGAIVGSLTYPSEGIPEGVQVTAVNLETNQEYTTLEHLEGSQYRYGIGYRIVVPAGDYHVYAVNMQGAADQRAYYNNFVECGFTAEGCANSEERITVTVEPGKDTKDIMAGDWYNPCVIPGGSQPTEKFDLPTC